MKWAPVFLFGGLSALAIYGLAEVIFPSSAVRKNKDCTGSSFPEVSGFNLTGKRFTLPQNFEGEVNLSLIAFTPEQQIDLDTWLIGVRQYESTPGFQVYELPTLKKGTPMFRAFLDGVMKHEIPDTHQRSHTITLYLDKSQFEECLGLPDEDRVYAVLTDRTGRVLWRAEGPFTEERGYALRDVLEFSRGA